MCTQVVLILLMTIVGSVGSAAGSQAADERIRPYRQNPHYWQYKGKPVLLLGGSVEDNLFQIPNLKEHLDELKLAGGNYVRNTMSSRDEGNVWPFSWNQDGKYNLDHPNDEYWRRFEALLRLAWERDIIVQIEVWDRFDFARGSWEKNPYNPANNITYTVRRSGLKERYPQHPSRNKNRFFHTVPELDNNETVLRYQQAQVDRLLSISLSYPNVLYCMDNETSGRPEWGAYWAAYIRRKAEEKGAEVHTTEMWDPWDLSHPLHRHTFDHPHLYTFLDISQNNHQKGQQHWDNLQKLRQRIAEWPRPINNIKIYGADTGRYGTDNDAVERFWRNVFGGAASSRFHRPPSGLGLGEQAQANIRSARMLADAFDFFNAVPDDKGQLLLDREDNEAYLTYTPDQRYSVYFTDGGSVRLDLRKEDGEFTLRWLDIAGSRWLPQEKVQGGQLVALKALSKGGWGVLIKRYSP